ncbi:hypothetical protein AB838_22025 [Rhodobacteraceae bacterium (ex Bugula neritina AB1)]|nr:hypothetical protein AB838_22025 [Rhodobacteraceae bacterium (ex Bugula neritina AB1)]
MTQTSDFEFQTAPSPAGIGVPQLTAYYLSNLIGAGIFVLPALAQETAGSWSMAAWLLMALCAGPMAWVMGRISIDFPNKNGILAFVQSVVSPRVSRGLALLIVAVMIIGNPIMGVISARYAIAAFALPETWLYQLAVAFMCLSIAFNLLGLRNSAKAQTVLVAGAMGTLIVLSLLSLANTPVLVPQTSTFAADGFFAAIGICFFAYLGWENVATIAPDVDRPERTFPRALLIAVPLVGLVYLLIALALLLTTQAAGGLGGNLAVVDHLVRPFNNPQLSMAVNLLALIVVILSTNAWVLSAARLLSATVRDGHLPTALAEADGSAGQRTLITLALSYAAVIAVMAAFGGAEDLIVPLVSAGFLLVYMVALYGAVIHYRNSWTGRSAVFALVLVVFFAASVPVETAIVITLFLLFLVIPSTPPE